MEKKYDIFISYRRDGGESTARMLKDHLDGKGYRVFLDVEGLSSGAFDKRLFSVIDECTDFLLILSPGALDRCSEEGDWVRLEIEHAMEAGKNIVPVMLRNFAFPEELPESIGRLRYQNGVESNYQLFDAFLEKLEGFLKTKPGPARRFLCRLRSGRRLVLATLLILALAAGLETVLWKQINSYPRTAREQNLTNDFIYYIENNMLQMEQAAEYLDKSYRACAQYLAHFGTADRNALLAELAASRRRIGQIDLGVSAMPEELRLRIQDSRFSSADAAAMHDYLGLFIDDAINSLYFMEFVTDPESVLDMKARESLLENYREILREELSAAACSVNLMLLPVTKEPALQEFKHEFLPGLYYFPLQPAGWLYDAADLESKADKSWNAIDKAMERITGQIGNENMEWLRERSELIRQLEEAGMSAGEAEQAVARIEGKSQLLSEKQAQVWELRRRLEEKKAEAWQKFAPSDGDEPEILWGKMLRFLSINMYDEAVLCIDAYRERVRGEDEYADDYCAAAIRMIRSIGDTGIDYGLLVAGYEPGRPRHGQYEVGDVIISVEGKPCHNYEEYSAIRSGLGEDADYRVTVLRAAEDKEGGLEQKELLIPAKASRVMLLEMSEKTEW